MLGIASLAKLIVFAVLGFIGWHAVRALLRLLRGNSVGDISAKQNGKGKRDAKIMDAETCSQCGVFVVKGSHLPHCNNPECPYKNSRE